MAALNWIFGTILFLQATFLGIDAQSFNIPTPPRTNFSCLNKAAGFYADTSSSCKIYHTCDEYGNKFTYHCPEETAFRQDALICDHAHLVRCFGREDSNNSKFNATCVADSVKEGTNLNATVSSKDENKVTRFGFSFNNAQAVKNSTKPDNKGNVGKFYSVTGNGNFLVNSSRNGNRNVNNYATVSQNNSSSSTKNIARTEKQSTSNQKSPEARNSNKLPLLNLFTSRINSQKTTDFNTGKLTDFPYLETLKSIQKNTRTTELPVYALTLSLKPLIPNELEFDPYYPRVPSTTEAYYTPINVNKNWSKVEDSTESSKPVKFEFPSVLPDLNSLEDIVDRRKLLYIPRIKYGR